MVISLTSTCLSTHALSTASLTTRLLAGRGCDIQGSSAPLVPADLPNLELWLDANGVVLNSLGNYFTDETASIQLAGFSLAGDGVDPNATYFRAGISNGKPQYGTGLRGGDEGGNGTVRWNGSQWELRILDFAPEDVYESYIYATGNTDYPWQATWPSGTTVTRTATTVDDLAENDETVVQWNNLVSGKPNVSGLFQPIFKSNVNGRKAVFFDGNVGDTLSGGGFSLFERQYSYYLVATSLLGSTTSTLHSAISLPSFSGTRGAFGANNTVIGASNATSRFSTLSRNVTNNAIAWSARFNAGSSGRVVVGSNKAFQNLTGAGTSPANNNVILLGEQGGNGITSNYSEVLVYKAFHDDTTANQIIDYLAAKWSITL